MRKLLFAITSLTLSASFALCAKLPTNQVRGEYIEARTADVYTGPCFANSEIGLAGDLAVMGWKIEKGSYDGVILDGLAVMGVVKAEGTLGDYARTEIPAKAVLIVDESANAEQRLALKAFAQKMGGNLLSDVIRVDYRPIAFSMADNNVHSMKAVMTAGNLAKLETRPLTERDQICHNEAVWYQPLTKIEHAMPAYTVANGFSGTGLGTSWNYSGNRGSFLGTFQFSE
ncbi:MAG: DUF1326 domain-containing protein [Acidobacteriaceae bacterium]|nr:DUF1326 domain-containing protein [Acidobacteriaceae bacterium]